MGQLRSSAADAGSKPVRISVDGAQVLGDLTVPLGASGVVLFAHGSGSGRHSPRNRYVATHLVGGGLATLLLDLLTADEEDEDARSRRLRFDIALLVERLVIAVDWLAADSATAGLPIGCFGASTGAAAALVAATQRPKRVRAVVSRGGRPDLAGEALQVVDAPTLLIVGGADELVLELNREAQQQMRCPVELQVVPGATHLFEEPGALDQVIDLARDWFGRHLEPLPRRAGAAHEERPSGGRPC